MVFNLNLRLTKVFSLSLMLVIGFTLISVAVQAQQMKQGNALIKLSEEKALQEQVAWITVTPSNDIKNIDFSKDGAAAIYCSRMQVFCRDNERVYNPLTGIWECPGKQRLSPKNKLLQLQTMFKLA